MFVFLFDFPTNVHLTRSLYPLSLNDMIDEQVGAIQLHDDVGEHEHVWNQDMVNNFIGEEHNTVGETGEVPIGERDEDGV